MSHGAVSIGTMSMLNDSVGHDLCPVLSLDADAESNVLFM